MSVYMKNIQHQSKKFLRVLCFSIVNKITLHFLGGNNNLPEKYRKLRRERAARVALSYLCRLTINTSPSVKGDMNFFEVEELARCLKHVPLRVEAASLSLTV